MLFQRFFALTAMTSVLFSTLPIQNLAHGDELDFRNLKTSEVPKNVIVRVSNTDQKAEIFRLPDGAPPVNNEASAKAAIDSYVKSENLIANASVITPLPTFDELDKGTSQESWFFFAFLGAFALGYAASYYWRPAYYTQPYFPHQYSYYYYGYNGFYRPYPMYY
ncbi:hypothetical protein K2X30_09365 [bacterium]|jgi:hypothetical protein|nr:hypothetical protein [bacterium]